jgi:hypothetical protein
MRNSVTKTEFTTILEPWGFEQFVSYPPTILFEYVELDVLLQVCSDFMLVKGEKSVHGSRKLE